jgi:hypothetical protein
MRALVPPDVMRNRGFSAACVTVLLLSAIFFAAMLYLPQFMQKILGYSPLKSGVGLLPLMATYGLVSFAAGPLYARLGAKLIVSLGAATIAVGMLLLSLVPESSGYGGLVAGMLVVGAGVGVFLSAVTTAAVTTVDSARAALAGGLVYMFQIGGGSVGLGLNTTIFAARSESSLDAHAAALGSKLTDGQLDLAHGILAGTHSATGVFAGLTPAVAHRLETVVRDGFVGGLHAAFRLDAALAVAGLVVAVLFVGGIIHVRPQLATTRRGGA